MEHDWVADRTSVLVTGFTLILPGKVATNVLKHKR